MYHKPRMCRTCLQMSRGDFKFVCLDTVDPLWESNSPNLKEQLLTLVPEMKIDGSGDVICTSCFIALRTGYEFKRMCQLTESKFQSHNYKYRRPFGVGPGSAQFHVTLNETHKADKNGGFNCQNINFLQADTSIDITEHHLYDASKPATRKSILTNALTDNLPEVTLETVENKKPPEDPTPSVPVPPVTPEEVKPKEKKRPQVARKKVTSIDIRKKYKIGSEISILKSDNKNGPKYDLIIKVACETLEFLKENQVKPEGLSSCIVQVPKLSDSTLEESNSYYFDKLLNLIPCLSCTQMFDTRYNLRVHEIEDHINEHTVFTCDHCKADFVNKDNLTKHISISHTHSEPTKAAVENKEACKPEESSVVKEKVSKPEEATIQHEIRVDKKVAEVNDAQNRSNEGGDEKTKTCEGLKPSTTLENDKHQVNKEQKLCLTNDKQKSESINNVEKSTNKVSTLSEPKLGANQVVQKIATVETKAKKVLEEKDLEDILKSSEIEDQLLEGDLKLDKLLGEKQKTEIKLSEDAKNLTATKSSDSVVDGDEGSESNDETMDTDMGFSAGDMDYSDDDSAENIPLASISNTIKRVIEDINLETDNSNAKVETSNSNAKNEKDNSCIQVEKNNSNPKIKTENSKVDKRAAVFKGNASNSFWYKHQKYRRCLICRKICRNRAILMQHCAVVHVPRVLCAFMKTTLNETTPPSPDKKVKKLEIQSEEEVKPKNIPLNTTPPSPDIVCNICGKILYYEEFIAIHNFIHIPFVVHAETRSHEEDEDIYSCYICSKRFPRERFLKLHNKQVHLTRPTRCDKCDREFKSELWYNRHKCAAAEEAIKEPRPPPTAEELANPVYCVLCDRYFTEPKYLKSHKVRIHNSPKKAAVYEAPKESNLDESTDEPKINEEGEPADVDTKVEVPIKHEIEEEEEEEIEKEEEEVETDEDGEAKSTISAENVTDAESEFLKSSASNYKRKSTDRMPKIQCDFCGELIDENIYDNHIYEHNKVRLTQKTRKSDVVVEKEEDVELENVKATLKCHLCTKRFQRQYHLTNHINKHLNGTIFTVEGEGDCVQSETPQDALPQIETSEVPNEGNIEVKNEPVENVDSSALIDNKENEQTAEPVVQAKIYECCGRKFRLKANMYRHYSASHPEKIRKKKEKTEGEVKPKTRSIKLENENENTTDADESTVHVKKRKRSCVTEESPLPKLKKRKIKSDSLDGTREILKRKKIENDIDVLPVTNTKPEKDNSSSSDVEFEQKLKFQCTQCDKSFKQICQLRDHTNVHTGERPYMCTFCEPAKGFTQTSSLYVHYRRVHSDVIENCVWEPYSKNGNCLTCSEVFSKHAVMFKHTKNYYLKEKFTCEICKKDTHMACHYFVHKIDPSVMMDFKLDDEPDVNQSVGDSDKPDTTNKRPLVHCTDCNKSFTKKRLLKFHKKSLAHFQQVQARKESNPSASETIIKGLANSVDNIIKTLNVMKSHSCNFCDATFTKKILLKKHRREMHRKKRIFVKKDHQTEKSEEKVKKVKRLVTRRKTTEVADESVEGVKKIKKLTKRRKTVEVSELIANSLDNENESESVDSVQTSDEIVQNDNQPSPSLNLDVEKVDHVDDVKEDIKVVDEEIKMEIEEVELEIKEEGVNDQEVKSTVDVIDKSEENNLPEVAPTKEEEVSKTSCSNASVESPKNVEKCADDENILDNSVSDNKLSNLVINDEPERTDA